MKKLLNRIILKIRWISRKRHVIPGYDEKREIIDHYRKIFRPNTIVETGTFLGDTSEHFKHKFKSVISIELSEELAERATKRFVNDTNVRIIQGDSSSILPSLLLQLKGSVLFWLDGHYSSEFFVGDEFIRTAKGEKNTPIEQELDIILQSPIESIILIDDARLFTGTDDYPTIKSIIKNVKAHKPGSKVFVKKDIIHIIPPQKKIRKFIGKVKFRVERLKLDVERHLFEKYAIPNVKNERISKVIFKKYLPANPVIIDCGAHIGFDSVELANLFKMATIHSFEPVAELYAKLMKNTEPYNNITCYPIALADINGTMDFYISEGVSDGSSSLLEPREHLKDHPDTFFKDKVTVTTRMLDSWAEEVNIKKVDMLWLDMQGFELKMLKASNVILETVSVIHTEVSTRETYKDAAQYNEYRSFLETKGFRLKNEAIPEGWDMGNLLFVKEKRK